MKITKISVFKKNLPLKDPYWLSGGRLRFDVLDATFIKIETDADLVGWGEATPWGHTYLPAHGPGVRAGVETMAHAVLGLDPRQVNKVERAMDIALPGHLYAKAPIDMACWDIAAQAAGLPIADLLGGGYREPILGASSISSGTPDNIMANIDAHRANGYRLHSIKVGANVDDDIARIHHIEERRRPDETTLYDVNRAWTRQQAVRVMNATAHLNVRFEQPGETLDDLAAISKKTNATFSVDEALHTILDMARIAREGIAEMVCIKLNRVGGLTKAKRIRDLALAHDIDCYVMPTGGTVLADAESLHLASTIPPERCLGLWACQPLIAAEVAAGRGPRLTNGALTLPDEVGLGVAPDEETLGAVLAVYQ
ncbi:mandelate racemase/muconate lactonizing enzyme family protein [Pararhizobium sp. YC-54]|uniref:mandelate racemase/muconate lactonizing enzyme family protein n=1 Tax=Pararhizobium sp. YC-54 TaxID=2986920 RepID=UPI0021F709AC|nr:mandelate racemase/muconate lactonizing enzyme family protein [Pararhizobium sp. YC-54]MCW0001893.1 mandelate racemase/muconate lactonizing enzyme family protein [Pararhizobium sp. YC-54]